MEMRSEPRAEGGKSPKKISKKLSMAQKSIPTPKGTSKPPSFSSSSSAKSTTDGEYLGERGSEAAVVFTEDKVL